MGAGSVVPGCLAGPHPERGGVGWAPFGLVRLWSPVRVASPVGWGGPWALPRPGHRCGDLPCVLVAVGLGCRRKEITHLRVRGGCGGFAASGRAVRRWDGGCWWAADGGLLVGGVVWL